MRTLILTVVLTASILPASAQLRQRPMTLSLGGQLSTPRGEFDQRWDKGFVGLGGNFSTPFKRLPFEGGLQFNWGYMGGDNKTVAVNVENLDATEGTMTVNSNVYAFHGLLRFKPFSGKIAPYIDGLAGWRTFTTRTKLRVDGVEGPLTNERNRTDAAFSFGWAAGIMVGIGDSFYVEGRVEKLQGDKVTYVDPATIAIDQQGAVTFETRTSNTDVLNVHLGVGFRF